MSAAFPYMTIVGSRCSDPRTATKTRSTSFIENKAPSEQHLCRTRPPTSGIAPLQGGDRLLHLQVWRQKSSRPATGLDPASEWEEIYKVCNQAQIFSNELLSFLEVDMETGGSGETAELPIWIPPGRHPILTISLYSRV